MKPTTHTPLVSVCITAWNIEAYLSQAIEGALMQETSFPYEIIIGEDASTDNTRGICLLYKNKFPDTVHLVLHEKNVGIGKNDISLIEKARGKFIAWCDGDDYWIDPHKLQKQVDILEAQPDVALVHTDWLNYHQNQDTFEEVRITPNELERNHYGIECINMMVLRRGAEYRFSTCMFRKSYFIETLNEQSELFLLEHRCNDFVTFIAMYEKGRLYHMNELSTVYRILNESASHTKSSEKRFRQMRSYFRLIIYIMEYYALSNYTRDVAVNHMLQALLRHTFENRMARESKEIVQMATDTGFQLSLSLRLFYLGSLYPLYHAVLKPVFQVYFWFRTKLFSI